MLPIRDDLKILLGLIPSTDGTPANGDQRLDEFERYVREQAELGLRDNESEIRSTVRQEAKPYIIASLVLGGAGLFLGFGSVLLFLSLANKRKRD